MRSSVIGARRCPGKQRHKGTLLKRDVINRLSGSWISVQIGVVIWVFADVKSSLLESHACFS